MTGLFAHLAAGVASKTGDNLVEQAKAKREAALRKLERDEEYAFRRSERMGSQEFAAEQNQLNRDANADMVTLEDGTAATRSGSTIKSLTNEQGDPVKLMTSKDRSPIAAEVKVEMWKSIGKTHEEATRLALGEGQPSSMDIDNMARQLASYEMQGEMMTGSEKRRERYEELRAELRERYGVADETAGAASSAPAADVSEDVDTGSNKDIAPRAAGMSQDQIIAQARQALAKGADKGKVAARLRELGVDPTKAGL